MKKLTFKTLLLTTLMSVASLASAGDIYLTGHDVDYHSNQNGYDHVILDYLRGSTAASSYRVGIVTGNTSFAPTFATGYASRDVRDIMSFADSSAFSTYLSTIDVLVVASEDSCGGCAFSAADVTKLNTFASTVTSFFNAGGDIFGQTGASNAAYYGFLPPSAVATGASISGSSGFTATVAGSAIGITSSMINGFPTHNRFTSYDPAFTVMETRGTEIISLGLRGGTITGGGGIVLSPVPEPETYAMLLAGLGVMGAVARRRKAKQA